MQKFISVAVCTLLLAGVARAEPVEMPSQFANCQTLEICFDALNGVAASRQHGAGSSLGSELAKRLETFGEPAKRELLRRAGSEDRAWRNLSGAILMHWQSFGPADVPALIEGLHKEIARRV